MDVKGAVQKARAFIEDLFHGEEISEVGLEEVVFDDESNEWKITISFSRPWDKVTDQELLFEEAPSRSYKVIRIADEDGTIKSLTDRTLPASQI